MGPSESKLTNSFSRIKKDMDFLYLELRRNQSQNYKIETGLRLIETRMRLGETDLRLIKQDIKHTLTTINKFMFSLNTPNNETRMRLGETDLRLTETRMRLVEEENNKLKKRLEGRDPQAIIIKNFKRRKKPLLITKIKELIGLGKSIIEIKEEIVDKQSLTSKATFYRYVKSISELIKDEITNK